MDLSNYLCQDEITQLDQTFGISLQHDSALVFWTGISPNLAQDWARRCDLKTLTMAMGSLYTDKSQESLRSRKSRTSWSKYMKGASWVFAQQACRGRYAIVLTNAPPNIYSTRIHSNYREIEEPILKGFEAGRHAIQIDYVHPTVPGAECFRYQVWPNNKSSEWYSFLECIAVKDILKKIVLRIGLQRSKNPREAEHTTPPHSKSEGSISLTMVCEDRKQEIALKKKAKKQLKIESEQRAEQEKRATKQLKVKREQQAAQERKATKQLKMESEQRAVQEKKAAKRLKVEKEQQAAQEKKAAKRLKARREQQIAIEKKAAKRLKVEREQQIAMEKKAAKRLKVEREQQIAIEKKAAKRLKARREQQIAIEKKAAKRLKVEREQQIAMEKKAAKRLKAGRSRSDIVSENTVQPIPP